MELEEQYKAERIALEKKYHELRQPVYTKRNAIIAGEGEVEATIPVGEEDVATAGIPVISCTNICYWRFIGVPGFWLQCIRTHPTIGGLIAAEDCPALEALQDVQCEYNEDWTGFKLLFTFGDNDYFTNKVHVRRLMANAYRVVRC